MTNSFAEGFYVVDEVGRAGILSGPFTDPGQADADRQERSIADDCGIWHRDNGGTFAPYKGYSLEYGQYDPDRY